MDYKFSLHAGEIGTYDWGSLLIRFASLAKVLPGTAAELMAGAVVGNATWKTGAELRGYIAFLHEFIHYIQDMYTSLGHWDYLVRREYTPIMLDHARYFSWVSGPGLPYPSAKLKAKASPEISKHVKGFETDLSQMHNKLTYIPVGDVSDKRSELILKYMRSLETPVPLSSGDEEPYTIKSLLEAEAAAMVYIQLRGLKMSDEQWEIAKDHLSLYTPGAMSEMYSGTIRSVLQVLEYKFDTNVDEDSTWSDFISRFTMLLTVFLVDLACAYPSPDQLKSDKSREEYEPGIRFMRLLRAFQILVGKKTINDFIKAIHNEKYEKAESYLLQDCEFPYPRAIDIYKKWFVYYDKMEIPSENPVLSFRKNCLKQRVKNYDYFVFKTPFLLTERTHLYWITPNGIESLGSSADYFDLDIKRRYFGEFLAQNKDWALVNFFLGSGKFVCPLAEARLCDAATPTCLSGIQKPEQFPPAPGCVVRRGLEDAEFSLASH